jgi:hypothetical protein
MSLPLLGSVAAGHQTIRFLFLLPDATLSHFVDARQRNERDARMGAAETGWEQVDSSAEFRCFY